MCSPGAGENTHHASRITHYEPPVTRHEFIEL